MLRSGTLPLRSLIALVTITALAIPVASVLGQSTTLMSIDAPPAGTQLQNGVQVDIGGWTVDTAVSSGTGIDQVRVYLDGTMDGGGRFLGNATYGKPRPDVAQSLLNPAYGNSGFDLLWTPSGLTSGDHTIYVYAHATNGDRWSYKTVTVRGPDVSQAPARSREWRVPPWARGYDDMSSGYGYDSMYGGQGYGSDSMYGGMRLPPPPPPPPPPQIIIVNPGGGVGAGVAAPTVVTVAAVTQTTVALTWVPAPGAVSYRVLQSVGNGPFTIANTIALTQSAAIVTGLTPNTLYRFQVVGLDAAGNQGLASAIVQTVTPP